MRIIVNLKIKNSINIADQQHIANYLIHKLCLRYEDYRNIPSDYCISNIRGGKLDKKTGLLNFKSVGKIYITSDDKKFIDIIKSNISNINDNDYGIEFLSFDTLDDPKFYDGWNHFITLSPILFKDKFGGVDDMDTVLDVNNFLSKKEDINKSRIITYNYDSYSSYMTNRVKKTLLSINPKLNLNGFKMVVKKMDKERVRSMIVLTKGVYVNNYATHCNVDIYCSKYIAKIIYNIGIGQSTGSGFGSLATTKNFKNLF